MIKIMEKKFVRVHSSKDIAVFTSLIVTGVILMLFFANVGANIGGFFLILIGMLFGLLYKSEYKENETGAKFLKSEYYFQQEMVESLLSAVSSKPESIDLSQEGKGKTLKLDIYFSKDTGKAYMQLYKYVPHVYEPYSKIYEYDTAKIANLIK